MNAPAESEVYYAYSSFLYILSALREHPQRIGAALFTLGYLTDEPFVDFEKLESCFQELLTKFPESRYGKLFIDFNLPSPTQHPLDGHAATLVIDYNQGRMDYQDPHGLLMPTPLLAVLMKFFPDYIIVNHRTVQQVGESLSCGVYNIENVLNFVDGKKPAKSLPEEVYRREQKAGIGFFKALVRDPKHALRTMGDFTEFLKDFGDAAIITYCGRKLKTMDMEHRAGFIRSFWQHSFPHIPAQQRPQRQPRPTVYMPPHAPGRIFKSPVPAAQAALPLEA